MFLKQSIMFENYCNRRKISNLIIFVKHFAKFVHHFTCYRITAIVRLVLLLRQLDLQRTCRDPGLNQGPTDLQSDALPTELSRHKEGINEHTSSLIMGIPLI